MILEVEKEDLKRIGHTMYQENGMLQIICSGETVNIESILLRNILKCFGEEYTILSEEDWIEEIDGKEIYDIKISTNLPFEILNDL